jgi:hypothetical protein
VKQLQSERHKLLGAVLGLAVVLTAMALCFGLPSTNSGAHDLDVGIIGDAATVQHFEQAVDKAAPGDYEFTRYESEPALRDAIKDRDAFGGIVAGPQGSKMLIATAAGSPIAQSLRGLSLGIAHSTGHEMPVEDVVPYTDDDPAGAGITSAALPLIFGGILPAFVLSHLFRRRNYRVGGALLFSLLAGLVISGLLDYGYGTIDGHYWEVAGGIALGMAAISLPALGLEAMFGAAGLGAMSATMILIGNPLSGISTAPAWLPSPWGAIGQLLPPGASGTVLRSNAFFDGNGSLAGLIVLTSWAVAGALLCRLAARRSRLDQQTEAVQAH